MKDLPDHLRAEKSLIDRALDKKLPPGDTRPAVLHQAMRHGVLNGGKRLRPILTRAACGAVGGDPDRALAPGLAIEILHGYTLVHDDLPCMDDDALRRGRPTAHIVFGEANALLAGDALLTLAFEWIGSCDAPAPWSSGSLVTELARATGSQGTIGGQVEDLAAENETPSAERLHYIHLNKTAAMLRACCRIGAMCAGAPALQVDALGRFGEELGLAFQIIDDLLDEEGSTEELGKPAGSDRENNKMTWPALHGLERSREMARETMQRSLNALEAPGIDPDLLTALAGFIVKRTS